MPIPVLGRTELGLRWDQRFSEWRKLEMAVKQSQETNITEKHKKVFEALVGGGHKKFALFSCFVNGEPTAAIVIIEANESIVNIEPLFVAVTEGMKLMDHDGVPPGPELDTRRVKNEE
jgi:hypothetical protein